MVKGTNAYNTVIQRINDPKPELCACEERVALAEHVELRVAIQDTCGHELVEDPDNERREEGEEDVVERERPGLVGDLPREIVEERIL